MNREIEQKLKNNIWKLYLHQILTGMFFSVPFIVLFWQENGLNLTQIMFLQSIFAILIVVFEIPTGYFADRYGRKSALVISTITGLIAIILYGSGVGFLHFLIAEIFFALSSSFISGTKSAFIYDTLRDIKREGDYKKIFGNTNFYAMLSLAASSILGGFIVETGLRNTLYASVPFFALALPLVLSMQEPNKHKLLFKKKYFGKIIRVIKYDFIKNDKLKWLIIYSGIIYAFNQSVLWLYQPYFKLSNIDVFYFGYIFASFQVVAAVASKYSYKIEKKLGQKYSLTLLMFLIGTSYLLMSNFIFLFSFSFCFIQQFVRGFRMIIITDYINKLTHSGIRATVLSVESLFGKLFYAITVSMLGCIADVYSLPQALFLAGITVIVFGIFFMLFFRKIKFFSV